MFVVFGIYDKILKSYLSVQLFANVATAIRSINETVEHALETQKKSDLNKMKDYQFVYLGDLKSDLTVLPVSSDKTPAVKGVFSDEFCFIVPPKMPVNISINDVIQDYSKIIDNDLTQAEKENSQLLQ